MFRLSIRVGLALALTGAAIGLALSALASGAPAQAARAERPIAPEARLAASAPFTIALSQVTSGLIDPVFVTHAGDGSGRLFIVERAGRIRVLKGGALLATPYLNITSLVESGYAEQGLLSVAFDPDYEVNGAFYLNYTANLGDGDTIVARYVVADPAADVANPVSVTTLLTIDQPQDNHNGGQLQFGPNDDYLYVGMGDGGSGGDAGPGHDPAVGNGQAPGTLLGKLLRIHVRGVPTYTIPASNPFTQTAGYRPEIWALGLRNPWRFSFDRVTGDTYIADVGQNDWEEVSYQPASSEGGENYGWRVMEGTHCFNPSSGCDTSGKVLPVAEYSHSLGCSVTGGYVYRGKNYPWLRGVYFYADYCSGRIWSLEQIEPGNWISTQRRDEAFNISSFGEDENGELYVAGFSNGRIYRIVSSAPPDLSTSTKTASNAAPRDGDVVTYTLVLRNAGGLFTHTMRLTDTLPASLIYMPGSLTATHGAPDDSAAPTLRWNGVLSNVYAVTVTYAATVSTAITRMISNTVTVDPGFAAPFARSAAIIVNGMKLYLPLIVKNG